MLSFIFPLMNYWEISTGLVVFAVSMKGLEDYADFCGERSSMPTASIRMNGSGPAVRNSGGSMLERSSTWYVSLNLT